MAASLGSQRVPGASKLRLDHLTKPGLGKAEHIRQAVELDSPFMIQGVCDEDIFFKAAALALLGPWIAGWRSAQARAMVSLRKALQPLETLIGSQMTLQVKQVAWASSPVWTAVMSSLLRWPDRKQALGYVQGMRITREIEHMGIFKGSQNAAAILKETIFAASVVSFWAKFWQPG